MEPRQDVFTPRFIAAIREASVSVGRNELTCTCGDFVTSVCAHSPRACQWRAGLLLILTNSVKANMVTPPSSLGPLCVQCV